MESFFNFSCTFPKRRAKPPKMTENFNKPRNVQKKMYAKLFMYVCIHFS